MINLKAKNLIFSICSIMILSGCNTSDTDSNNDDKKKVPDNFERVTISQGVWGNVRFWQGDHMPGTVGEGSSSGTITPVYRVIRVYKGTSINDNDSINASSSFYEHINSELVAVVYSDTTGFYQTELPTGVYSIFTEEDQGLYANGFNSELVINPVTIDENSISQLDLDITYNAAF